MWRADRERNWTRPLEFASKLLVLGTLAICASCDPSGGRVNPPSIAPAEMTQAALKEYDANGDQALAGEELDQCPGLKRGASLSDTNRDGKLTAEEIAARLQTFVSARIGLVGLNVKLSLDGKSLDGARVVLTPEKFLGGAVQRAEGISNPDGQCWFRISDDLPGVQPGIYRVEVYKPGTDGAESIPARYNAQTMFGVDAGADSPDVNEPQQLKLTSK